MYKVGRCLLHRRLREARMSQQELAEKLNMSKTQISDYINNRRRMSLGTAYTIAKAVKCSMDDLYEAKKIIKALRKEGYNVDYDDFWM